MTSFVRSDAVERIRARIDHPIVDADGHYLEFMPLVKDILRDIAGSGVVARYEKSGGRGGHLPVRGFWGLPEKATLDRMTVTLPELLYQRLDQIGVDFAVLYPTPGPIITHPDDELRQAVCRAINIYSAEVFADYGDRLAPAALIPTYTPEEAVAELDHAIGTLGLKITRMDGAVPRTKRPNGTKFPWVDSLGHDSLYDYDPVWARCQQLGVVPSFHGVGFGWGSRVSSQNYVHNHIGSFSAAQEAVCRSLVMGGAPRRFPDLRFAFLEGGVAWACQLFGDLLGHYEKRNKNAISQFDPAQFDLGLARELFRDFARGRMADRQEPFETASRRRVEARQSLAIQSGSATDPERSDDFAESGIEAADHIADIFGRQFFFGCEADDPLSAMAFARRLLPGGINLRAIFSSDIGHWDVPDMREVLPDAWQLVEAGHLNEVEFRAFTCGNAVEMLTSVNPHFCDGTVLEGAGGNLYVLDLLIHGGEVVDGSGEPRRRADVGVRGGRIVEIGTVTGAAQRTIDAEGRIVAPGFIDIHTHYDAQAFWDPTLSPSPLHGVTTVVGGNCGFSIAPLDDASADYLMRMLARVEGIPLESLEAGVPWNWGSTGEYLDQLSGTLAPNAGFMVGHSALRRAVMGKAATERNATADELTAMCALLRASLSAGGMGFSTSHGPVHTDGDGTPVPSRHADAEELIALCAVCAEYPGTSLEFIPARHDEEYQDLMVRMSRAAHRPLNWNVMSVCAANLDECLDKLEVGSLAVQRGAKVVGLVIPRASRSLRTFYTGFLLDSFPGWAEPMALPPADKLALLRDSGARKRLLDLSQQPHPLQAYSDWPNVVIGETFAAGNARYRGRKVSDIAEELGKAPFDALLDIVCDDELRTMFGNFVPEETSLDWQATARVLRDPRVVIGGSDAGAHVDGLATFNYTTTLLQHLVREQELMSLEEAVHRITDIPARLYGIRERGRLALGAFADVVVFDAATIAAEPAATRFDLPAGAGRLYAEARGIDHVIVNGVPIVSNGAFADERPGTLLRSGRDTANPALS